jgi:AraC-like DNA-binding protein
MMGLGQYWGEAAAAFTTDFGRLTLTEYRPDSKCPRHAHENPGLFLLIRGQHRESDESRELDQVPLSPIWHGAGVAHSTSFGPKGAIGLNVSIDRSWLAGGGLDQKCLDPLGLEASPIVIAELLRILLLLRNGQLTRALFENGITEALSCGTQRKVEAPRWLHKAREIIHGGYKGEVRIGTLSRQVGVDRMHLARCFRAWTGHSVSNYAQMLRVHEAFRIAQSGECTFAEAATEAGLSDQSHLARLSRKYYGRAPKTLLPLIG